MKNNLSKFLVLEVAILCLLSCEQGTTDSTSKNVWTDSTSIDFNTGRVKEEELQINLYLGHHKELNLAPTGTGLRYEIIRKTEGIKAESGDSVDVIMKIYLLNEKICYETDSSEVDQFLIDRSHVESGIQEGIKLMKQGEKAIFILPSNLAHGLLGDFKTIPPMSPIVVNLELNKVIKNKIKNL